MRATIVSSFIVGVALSLSWTETSAAEFWEGVFTAFNAKESERWRSKGSDPCELGWDGAPIQITIDGIDGYEWGCKIVKITSVRELDARIFDLDCASEGIEYQTRAIIMRSSHDDGPDGLLIYPGREIVHGNPPPTITEGIRLYRCNAG